MIDAMLLSAVLMMQDAASSQPMKETTEHAEPEGVTGKARELFLLADEATRSIESVRFDMVREGTGSQAAATALVKAHVVMVLDDEGGRKIAMSGMSYGVDSEGEPQVIKTQGAMTAEGARRLDFENEAIVEGPANIQVFGPLVPATFNEFGHPTPFSQDEINGDAGAYEGQAFVGEILCDVVWVQYNAASGGAQARWYFGAEDHLPRRVERLRPLDDQAGAQVQTLFNLEVNGEVDEMMFAIDSPEGFTVQTIDPSAFID